MGDEQCTLVIIGDGAVGKSSIIAAFKNDGFGRVYKQTIGCDFYEKMLQLRGDRFISLRVWDIGGQSLNSKNMEKYLTSSRVFFLVYDVTNPESFANLDDWLSMIRKYSTSEFVYLIGNKVDLIQHRQITEQQHDQFINDNNLRGGLFLSAKTGENVVKSFYKVAAEAIGIKLNSAELAMFDVVVKAHIIEGADEGRTDFADDIEKEDAIAEQMKREQEQSAAASSGCGCEVDLFQYITLRLAFPLSLMTTEDLPCDVEGPVARRLILFLKDGNNKKFTENH
eukprot:gene5653-11403_t